MKWLILEYIYTIDDTVGFKVHDQSHRGSEFGNDRYNTFKTSNTIRVCSMVYPAAYMNMTNDICVRGCDIIGDDVIIHATMPEWNLIKEAVQEYNDYYGFTGECILGEIQSPILPDALFTLE